MSTAKKTLYAAIGAGSTVVEKARRIPQRFGTIRPADLRGLPKSVQAQIESVPHRASEFVGGARKLTGDAADRLLRTYGDLSKRGESLAKKVQGSVPTKRAAAQTKTAKSKVKAAATSVKNAAEASVDAVSSAVDKASERVG